MKYIENQSIDSDRDRLVAYYRVFALFSQPTSLGLIHVHEFSKKKRECKENDLGNVQGEVW